MVERRLEKRRQFNDLQLRQLLQMKCWTVQREIYIIISGDIELNFCFNKILLIYNCIYYKPVKITAISQKFTEESAI